MKKCGKKTERSTADNSIRRTLPRMIRSMVLFLIVLILPANVVLQYYMHHQSQRQSSYEVFGQFRQIIEMNEMDLEQAKEEFKQKCIQSAEMAAYFVEHYPSVTSDFDRILELAEKLDVDELHFFTPDGEIYSGTLPQYYGYTFESGEQMAFFAPMLEDKSLQLCQDIMPNTAEGKEMQYAAVWLKDGSGIVQIGMEPRRLRQVMSERSLAKLVESIPIDLQGYLHIVDKKDHKIIASTAKNLIGYDVGSNLDKSGRASALNEFHSTFQGKRFCVYTQDYGNYVLVRTYASDYPIQAIFTSTFFVLIYIGVAGLLVLGMVIWYVNRKLSNNLTAIVAELKKIESGHLEKIVLKTDVAEFDELLFYINQLMKSIRLNWDKMSYVIDKGRLPIGIFEYNAFYKKTFVSERLLGILGIDETEIMSEEELAKLVQEKLKDAEERIESLENPVCEYDRNGETAYLRIEKETDEYSVTYYVTDVSLWWSEMHLLREQSNRDTLTGLYNRRGFGEKMAKLFASPDRLGYGILIFLDADGLKKINDIYGHYAGDLYLRRITEVIRECFTKNYICARMGGDEFAVFLYHFETAEKARDAMEALKQKRGIPFESEEPDIKETLEFSVGAAYYPMDGEDYHLLMHMADENMYQEKRSRKHFLQQ